MEEAGHIFVLKWNPAYARTAETQLLCSGTTDKRQWKTLALQHRVTTHSPLICAIDTC